jgi:hypothetical protein
VGAKLVGADKPGQVRTVAFATLVYELVAEALAVSAAPVRDHVLKLH